MCVRVQVLASSNSCAINGVDATIFRVMCLWYLPVVHVCVEIRPMAKFRPEFGPYSIFLPNRDPVALGPCPVLGSLSSLATRPPQQLLSGSTSIFQKGAVVCDSTAPCGVTSEHHPSQ
jgi:hypothetical protein